MEVRRTLRPAGSRIRRAGRAVDKRYLRTLFALYLVLLAGAFCVAVWAQSVEHDFTTAVTALGAVLVLVPTVEVVAKRDERHDATRHRQAFLYAFVCALVPAAVTWLVLAALPSDVTAHAKLRDGRGLGPDESAELTVAAEPDGYDELVVTLAALDEVKGGSPCLPVSRLRFSGEDLKRPVVVDMADEFTTKLPLDAAGPRVAVSLTLIADEGCRVTLTRKSVGYE